VLIPNLLVEVFQKKLLSPDIVDGPVQKATWPGEGFPEAITVPVAQELTQLAKPVFDVIQNSFAEIVPLT
jgi:hypothetical protein